MNGAKVSTVHEKVGGKRMTESVWANVFGNAGEAGVFFDDTFNWARSEATIVAGSVGGILVATVVEEEGG